MNYRQKERLIDKVLYNKPFIPRYSILGPLTDEELPLEIRKLYLSLGYNDHDIRKRWREIQSKKKDKISYKERWIYRRRWYRHKSRHRYYRDRNKDCYYDKPPHLRLLKLSLRWSDDYINLLKKEKLIRETKKEERKLVKYSSEFRQSKIHKLLNKNKKD